jgi:curli biogenesis system outer membrane secretion channel CsgG
MKNVIALTMLTASTAGMLPLHSLANEKPTVAVIEFSNESGAGWWRGGVGRELAGMLSNELGATRSFRVLERAKLDAVLDE